MDRYVLLVRQALRDLATEPGRPGVYQAVDDLLICHLRHSRTQVQKAENRLIAPDTSSSSARHPASLKSCAISMMRWTWNAISGETIPAHKGQPAPERVTFEEPCTPQPPF
jgi:hypothetical protein